MKTKWPFPFEHETAIGPQLKESAEGYESIRDSRLPPSDMLPLENGIETLLIKNERVTPDTHWQDVRLLTFLTNDQNLYNPGDTVTIFPKNFPEDVQTLIDLQGWNDIADVPLSFKARPPDFYNAENFVSLPRGLVPLKNSTLRQLLIHNLDFTAIPKRSFFQMIAHHTDDPMHKERLLEFANPVFTDEFYDYATRPRRSILEVLQDFPSVKLPWSWALALFPVIRGREFSICSGGTQRLYHYGNELIKFQLLIAIVKYKTVLKKIRQGLCSRYIASLHGETLLKVKMSSNAAFDRALKLNSNYPVIMVGPGTGVAPCRSLIWQRAADAFEENHTVHDAILFFGNRNANADYFFRDEWAIPSLRLQVFTAFSRDQRQKIYVQDLIRREGPRVHALLAQNALIIVCGSSGKMPQQVREAFLDVMEEHGGPWESRQKVEETFNLMEKRGQYLQETW
jgi:sulfite reductase alpha subunit-like flavoprotein